MKKDLHLEISSDLSYEGMVVEIVGNRKVIDKQKKYYSQTHIATLDLDKGVENIQIKIFPPINKQNWDFSYNEFTEILQKAKKLLIQVNKEPK